MNINNNKLDKKRRVHVWIWQQFHFKILCANDACAAIQIQSKFHLIFEEPRRIGWNKNERNHILNARSLY